MYTSTYIKSNNIMKHNKTKIVTEKTKVKPKLRQHGYRHPKISDRYIVKAIHILTNIRT